MLFTMLLMVAATFLLNELLRPSPDIEDARPSGLGDFNIPTATEERVIPIIWGTVLMEGPNVIWYGDLYQEPVTQYVKTGMFSGKRQITGYRYHLGLQMGLCRGEIDEISRIWVGDDLLYTGSLGATTLPVDSPNFFGGDLGAGGLVGTLRVHVGTSTQAVNAYLSTFQDVGGDSPRYKGLAYVVWEYGYVGTSTSLAAWKFEVKRIPNPLSLSAGVATVNTYDCNPISVLYELMTDSEWGINLPSGAIDTDSFEAAAETLAAEGNGFSFVLDRQMGANELVEEIQRQIDGVVFMNPVSGKFEVNLARGGYTIGDQPQVTDDELIEIRNHSPSTWAETTNVVQVNFKHRGLDYKGTYAQAQDTANVRIQDGAVITSALSYPGVKDPSLANEIAWRDLRALARPLIKAELVVNRKFYSVTPCSVIAWTSAQNGYDQLPMRVSKIDHGDVLDDRIVLYVIEDVFEYMSPSGGEPPETGWVAPADSLDAFPSDEQLVFEAPRAIATRDPENLGAVADKIWCAGRQQDVATLFEIRERHASGTPSGDYATAGEVYGFLFIGELTSNLDVGSGYPLANLDITPTPDTQAAIRDAFSVASLEDVGANLINLLLVGNEFMLVAGVASDNGGNVRVTNVYRGVLDSVQEDHTSGDPVFLIFVGGGLANPNFTPGDTVDIKLLPQSRSDQVLESAATTVQLTMDDRVRKPYPPSEPILNGVAYDDDPSMEGVGAGADTYGIGLGLTRRDFRSTNEIEALVTDAANLFGDFPSVYSTEYTVKVYNDPAGTNTLLFTLPAGDPDFTLLRNLILKGTDGVLPTTLRLVVETRHTIGVTEYQSLYDLVHDFAPITGLTGQFNFGALDTSNVSNLYTATVAGTYAVSIGTAFSSGSVQYRLNGGSWVDVITAGNTSGNITGVVVSDTIEVQHTSPDTDALTFLAMNAPGAGDDGYAILFT